MENCNEDDIRAAHVDLGVYQFPTTLRVGRPQGAFKNIGSWNSHLEIWGFFKHYGQTQKYAFSKSSLGDFSWHTGLGPALINGS